MTFLPKVHATIRRYRMLSAGDTVLAGVSGGADSVALLLALNRLRPEYGLKIHVIHCNHRLRRSADTDERFVKKLAAALGIKVTARRLDIRKKGGESLEDRARRVRYAAFLETARRIHADCLALGHHLDDCAETVLMRILRGTGLQGLQGILPVREFNGLRIIRPLIETHRQEILAFLTAGRQPYRVDPTNREFRFFRNKVRLELLPWLETHYSRNIHTLLARLAFNSGLDYDFLYQYAAKVLSRIHSRPSSREVRIPVGPLKALHPGVQRMAIRLGLAELKGDMNRFTLGHVNAIIELLAEKPAAGPVHLPGGMRADKRAGFISLRRIP